MLGVGVFLDWLRQPQAALAAREERRRDLGEMLADRGERLVEAPLDGLCQLHAQLLELLQARLEILALLDELGQALLLALVLLLRQRVDLPERLAAALQALDPLRALVALGRLRARLLQAPPGFRCLTLEPRPLDVDAAGTLAGLRRGPPHLG